MERVSNVSEARCAICRVFSLKDAKFSINFRFDKPVAVEGESTFELRIRH